MGLLVEILTAPYAVLVDAFSFLASGSSSSGIRKPEERPSDRGREEAELLARAQGRPPSSSATRTCAHRLGAPRLELLLQRRRSRASSSSRARARALAGVIGLVFSVGAAGSLVAAFTATRISRRFGIGPTTIAGGAAGPAFLAVAFAPAGNAALPLLVAAQLVFGFTVVAYNIVQVSYRQAICPPRLQGRMNSAMRFMVWGTIPLGTLAGGALGHLVGLREAIVDRGSRQRPLVPLDPALAPASPARDARAGRRHPVASSPLPPNPTVLHA